MDVMHWGCVGVYNGYRLVRADFVVFPLSGENPINSNTTTTSSQYSNVLHNVFQFLFTNFFC